MTLLLQMHVRCVFPEGLPTTFTTPPICTLIIDCEPQAPFIPKFNWSFLHSLASRSNVIPRFNVPLNTSLIRTCTQITSKVTHWRPRAGPRLPSWSQIAAAAKPHSLLLTTLSPSIKSIEASHAPCALRSSLRQPQQPSCDTSKATRRLAKRSSSPCQKACFCWSSSP